MSKHQFLLEILCEEIPANALPAAREQLVARFGAELAEAGLTGCEVKALSTVRRLIAHIDGLPDRQADREEEVTGPPVRGRVHAGRLADCRRRSVSPRRMASRSTSSASSRAPRAR